MSLLISIGLTILGLALVLFFAEKLVKGSVGLSLNLGLSTFLISVIFIGFDPDNLFVGAASSYEGVAGFALGSIIGAVMVAIAFAFGVSALFAPMTFEKAPSSILVISIVPIFLLGLLGVDGVLSRLDGIILLAAYAVSLIAVWQLGKRGHTIRSTGEVAESLEKSEKRKMSAWKATVLIVIATIAIIAGSEMLVEGARDLIGRFGLSATFIGMTVLAFLVSVEELARELPAALKGRPEISVGNVVGSILAMFLFNAGVIALVNPVPVPRSVFWFYLPAVLITTVIISLFLFKKTLPRWGGALLILLYVGFVAGSYLVSPD